MEHSGVLPATNLVGHADPLHVLRHEHEMLAGQLALLESPEMLGDGLVRVLQSLIRDSGVHFQREGILLRVLDAKLGESHGLEPLFREHGELRRQAMVLCQEVQHVSEERKAGERVQARISSFAKRFRDHILHEERVVYVLVRSRLSAKEQKDIAHRMLVA